MRESRGRSRNSSPSVSSHISCTQGTLVKNRCPPRSKRKPSCSTVFAIPPTWESASNTTPAQPREPSRCAAVSPAGPAPSTANPAVVRAPIPLHPSGVLRQLLEEVAPRSRRLSDKHPCPDVNPLVFGEADAVDEIGRRRSGPGEGLAPVVDHECDEVSWQASDSTTAATRG